MTEHTRMRIGDADRDVAITSLGEHYATGRLTKEEYEERAEAVWQAKVRGDLTPLFADLPGSGARASTLQPSRASAHRGRPGRSRKVAPVFPILAVVLVALTIILSAPLLLLGLFFLSMCDAGHRHGRMGHRWQGS